MEDNVIKHVGELYLLPEGYTRRDGRFGWDILDEKGGLVTHLFMTDYLGRPIISGSGADSMFILKKVDSE